MAKGPLITDRTRKMIADVYLKHRDWRAKEIQDAVNRQMNGKGPGLSAVQKELTKIRKRDAELSAESSELDMPWTTFSLAKYPVTPEAVPTLLKLAIWVLEHRHSTSQCSNFISISSTCST